MNVTMPSEEAAQTGAAAPAARIVNGVKRCTAWPVLTG
jgi:hypothetical protein